ncbi:transposase, partial [Methylobacterium sp.]|uniref:transposase n=1 Tax=Methylobacterium sp. TaxID=409 RepID=UPI0025D6ADA0
MTSSRARYPSDVSDEEWALVAPYLTLLREDAGQREHSLREVFNGLRYVVKTGAPWRLRIPTEAGHPFRREAGQRSDLMSAT